MPSATKRTSAKPAEARPTPEQFLGAFPTATQALAEQLRQLVKQTIPGTSEAVYPGWHLIGYRTQEGRSGRYFCFVAPYEDRVALGFEYGVLLSNAPDLLEGSGTQVRYVTVRHQEDIQPQEFAALIAEAAMVAATRGRR